MKQTLKTVYIPVNHDGNQCIHSPNVGFLEKQELITFNVKEFNKFISEIIKDSLNTAAENAKVEDEWNNEYYEFAKWTKVVDEQSIKDSFEEILEKFKL